MGSLDDGYSHMSKEHARTKVTLTFPISHSQSGQEMKQARPEPTYIVYAMEMIKLLEKRLDSRALDPASLPTSFKIMLPTERSGGAVTDFSTSLYSAVALAVNISHVSCQKASASAIGCEPPVLIEAVQVEQIIAISEGVDDQGNQIGVNLSVRSALQSLARMLPATISIHGDVAYFADDTASQIGPVVFAPDLEPNVLRPGNCFLNFTLGSRIIINLAYTACTGRFWVLLSKSVDLDYMKVCQENLILKTKLAGHDGLLNKRRGGGAFRAGRDSLLKKLREGGAFGASKTKMQTVTPEIDSTYSAGGDKAAQILSQLRRLCLELHNIVIKQRKQASLPVPAFTQYGILRMLAHSRSNREGEAVTSLVVQIGTLSIRALPEIPSYDRAIGMVFGQHFFNPASTDYFLCESIALLGTYFAQPDERENFHLDQFTYCSDVDLLLHNMGPRGSQMDPATMHAVVAASTVLSLAMPVKQALVCWKSLNRGIFAPSCMSTVVKAAGCALISVLAYARLYSEKSHSDMQSAKDFPQQFFEQLQSKDEDMQQLRTIFLSETECELSPEYLGSIGQVLVALQVVSDYPDLSECLENIEHGTPSASIVGLVLGTLIGQSGLDKISGLPFIHDHQATQLRAITSMLASCCQVCLLCYVVWFDLVEKVFCGVFVCLSFSGTGNFSLLILCVPVYCHDESLIWACWAGFHSYSLTGFGLTRWKLSS